MTEIWKDIDGYVGLYQVSNLGNVKSLNYRRTGRERPLTFKVNSNDYLSAELYKNGNRKFHLVHRLVADAFIPDKTNFKYVDEEDRLKYVDNLDKLKINHKDENPENNCVNNLEWCTQYYNLMYGTHNERVGRSLSKKVYQYDLDGNFIREWVSASEVERQLGYAQSNINACCLGKRKTAYGYIWRYAD